MSLLLDILVRGGFLIDALGVAGLGMAGIAAARLAGRHRSWGGSLLAMGALLLLLGRISALAVENLLTHEAKHAVGVIWTDVFSTTPVVLLTIGLAGVVWGFWGHQQWLHERR